MRVPALVVACLALAAVAASERATYATSAVITVGSVPTMSEKRPRFDYASALFVDSTRGAAETGYWKLAAGEVTLVAGADTIPLPASRDVFSGVGYFSHERAFTYAAGTAYTIDVSGSDSIGAIHASVRAPTVPRILAPVSNTTAPRTRDLVIRWTADSARDSVQIDIQPHSPSGYPHLVLRVPDTGRFALSKSVLYDFPSDYATMITLTRSRQTPLRAAGVSDGAFRAQAADFVHVYVGAREVPKPE